MAMSSGIKLSTKASVANTCNGTYTTQHHLLEKMKEKKVFLTVFSQFVSLLLSSLLFKRCCIKNFAMRFRDYRYLMYTDLTFGGSMRFMYYYCCGYFARRSMSFMILMPVVKRTSKLPQITQLRQLWQIILGIFAFSFLRI